VTDTSPESPASPASPASPVDPAARVLRGEAVTRPASLLRAEILRIRSRRFVRILLALAFALVVAVSVGQFFNHARPSAADVAAAKVVASQQRAFCIQTSGGLPPDQVDQVCGTPYQSYLPKSPFLAGSDLPNVAIALGAGTAAVLFLVGTTSGGADWAAKTMPALLFWEPRRLRVLFTKLAVVVGLAGTTAVVTQGAWLAIGSVVTATRGTWDGRPPDFWSQLGWLDVRLTILGVLAAAGGYVLASLIRNTGAALGVTFVYLVIVEAVVGQFVRSLRPYLVTQNVAALVNRGGVDVPAGLSATAHGFGPETIVHLSNLRGGGTLLVAVAVLAALAGLTFKRRDLT
jgi:ABC-2 type transport system permease protein